MTLMLRPTPRILIFGFGRFGHYSSNITESIIAALPRSKGIATKVFDVKFDAKLFSRTFDTLQPQVIIGLGQHPRARKIRIERRAQNLMARTRTQPPRPIDGSEATARFATLRLPSSAATTITYNAGTYVCNFSMWQMSRWCERHDAKWAFLHIPRDTNIPHTVRYLQAACAGLRKTTINVSTSRFVRAPHG